MTAPTSTSTPTQQQHAQSDSYTQSGFLARMGWGKKPALLLIDVCKAYWTPGSPLDLSSSNPHAAAAALASMRRLLAAARGNNVPVVWTSVEYNDPEMRDAGLFWRKAKVLDVFRAGDPRGLGDWVDDEDGNDRLRPAVGEVLIKKKYASSFFGTTLATELACLGVDTLVIAGVSTSGCVRATTLDAMQNGYRPMVSQLVSLLFTVLIPLHLLTMDRSLVLPAGTEAWRSKTRICLIWTPNTQML